MRCPMLHQELLVPEAPKHTQTGHTAIPCSGNIHITIANIETLAERSMEIVGSMQQHLRCRLLGHLSALANGQRDIVSKETLVEKCHTSLQFVTCHGYVLLMLTEGLQQGNNHIIRHSIV